MLRWAAPCYATKPPSVAYVKCLPYSDLSPHLLRCYARYAPIDTRTLYRGVNERDGGDRVLVLSSRLAYYYLSSVASVAKVASDA